MNAAEIIADLITKKKASLQRYVTMQNATQSLITHQNWELQQLVTAYNGISETTSFTLEDGNLGFVVQSSVNDYYEENPEVGKIVVFIPMRKEKTGNGHISLSPRSS